MFRIALIHPRTWIRFTHLLRGASGYDAVFWQCGNRTAACGSWHAAATLSCGEQLCAHPLFRENRREGSIMRIDFLGADLEHLQGYFREKSEIYSVDDSRLSRRFWMH